MSRLLAFFILAGALCCRAQSDIFFYPCDAGASVSFEGKTQGGKDVHRLEVRRLGYTDPRENHPLVTVKSCVIYYAGWEYGPEILQVMEAISPLVRKVSSDKVEIFFTQGVSRHIRQQWKLLGHTAKLVKEEDIDWRDDPRMKNRSRP